MAGGGITILFFPPAAIGATTALSLKITGSALMSGGIAGELRYTVKLGDKELFGRPKIVP